jgi:hypothetical protein
MNILVKNITENENLNIELYDNNDELVRILDSEFATIII